MKNSLSSLNPHLWWILPILIMVILTPFTPFLDKKLASYYYVKGSFNPTGFHNFMFSYAVIPTLILGFLSFPFYILSFVEDSFKSWRKPSLVLLLTMAIGAGFIVHTLLKDHWGRPRPKQVIEYGGKQPFLPYYQPNFHQPEPSRSFPCGHCTMGFYFFAPALLLRRYGRSSLSLIMLLFALIFGALMGWARIAQGGHFFSDVLMTGLIMWLTAHIFDRLVYNYTLKGLS